MEVWDDTEQSFVPIAGMDPIMAYPEIDVPIYELLKGISPDYIIPNLHKLPENSATIMEVNTRFLESLFVGLNHEMSRELLWREFPTDQRGSYMRMFWDKSDNLNNTTENPDYDLTTEIHTWTGELGENIEANAANLVLVVRGKLLEKFPDTLIFAQEAEFVGTPNPSDIKNSPRKMKTNGQSIFPSFTAKLGSDVTLVGFNMKAHQALGQVEIDEEYEYTDANAGYYFVMQERPGQLRFGLDDLGPSLNTMTNWDNLSWQGLGSTLILDTTDNINFSPNFSDSIPQSSWGDTSAIMAYILSQKPVLFLVHSKDMIDNDSF